MRNSEIYYTTTNSNGNREVRSLVTIQHENDLTGEIISLGSHPCCYINLPESHPWYGKDYYDIPLDVHGGLTYGQRYSDTVYRIGWDYAHRGDFYMPQFPSPGIRSSDKDKKWTLDELKDHLYEALHVVASVEYINDTL